MGIFIFMIWNILLIIAIFVFGALASAVPVIEYNYYALYQNICTGLLFLSWIVVWFIINYMNDRKK